MNPLDITLIERIRDEVRALDPDDADLLADMIEGETDADRLMDWMLDVEATAAAHIAANKDRIRALLERNNRLAHRVYVARANMQRILDAAGLRKMERPEATVSLRAVAPKVEGDDITGLPEDCVVTKYAPDRKAIKERLEAGEEISGWRLTNGGQSISVRRS